jgi:hypothetical protein
MERGDIVKKWILLFFGSLFLQIFCWAMYSILEMRIWLCGLSAVVTALLYHYLQVEEQTGLSRKNVFLAVIFAPFAVSVIITILQMAKYPQLSLLSAELDGVSPMTELVSLYMTRVMINGVFLLIFAPIDRAFRKDRSAKDETKTA